MLNLVDLLSGAEARKARVRRLLRVAVLLSLLLHAAVLLIGYSSKGDSSANAVRPRLLATLVGPARPLALAPPVPRRKAAPKKPAQPRLLTAPAGAWVAPSWSAAERTDMDKFLNELAAPAAPPTSGELSQRARAMARQMEQTGQDDGAGEASGPPAAAGKSADPFSLEMYFDAFVRKLNRSAAFVKNDPRAPGSRKALVEISLNPDGSLKSYRVLRSGDQAAEIAYVKSVIDRASPFSAFPPDISNVRNSLTIRMCIFPARAGGGSGFSRSFGGQDCRD